MIEKVKILGNTEDESLENHKISQRRTTSNNSSFRPHDMTTRVVFLINGFWKNPSVILLLFQAYAHL